uniref:Zgc:77056 n=1 Tax=Oryzias latipes TaxID=8090 RepID=A0A3B3IE40_ORYLA
MMLLCRTQRHPHCYEGDSDLQHLHCLTKRVNPLKRMSHQSKSCSAPQRQVIPTPEDDSGSDREDEQPQVVVLTDGDLSAEMIKDIKAGGAAEKDEKSDGKILFKKPAKRSSAEKFQGISASSSKKKKKKEDEEEEGGEREGVEKKAGKKIKNISLLSFGGDDEDEED